ncbi:methylmalonyl-CoA mutase subunit beta [Aliifodinibius salicampi]|uniref:methylmalonyl-CoA mutase n=1 Tax=Fodinibius salicampi TaxID=1920655 RepID=A0ABT3PYE4_9BACT|nr:methylmalonyl-CoA mutase family protein [Fodinibius salicampi]MCW9712879.1 methylmalonyl-CoA mutase subunit beta [Fodinibius salicampi]
MSDTSSGKKSLFKEFPPISTEEWEKIIERDLKGANYKKKLRWQTNEGIAPLPFYRRDELDRQHPVSKKNGCKRANSWEIREPIFAKDISSANQSARNALKRGSDALQFHLTLHRTEGLLGGDLQGLPIQNQKGFHQLFDNISIEDTALHFDAGLASPALLGMLWNESKEIASTPKKIKASFSYDPFIYLLSNGHYPKGKKQLSRDILQLAEFTDLRLPNVYPLCIDARTYHNMGGTIVQELGYALAGASEYLTMLTNNGYDVNKASDRLYFSYSIGSNYFLEIAKFRAARLLWKNLLEAYGGNPEHHNIYLHGETSRWNKTLYDPYTNMLRTSTEGMSAAIAGCDSITVLPFDQHFRHNDNFSQRIARNQQLILREEAYLDKVEDPSAGSYYIEKLTDKLGQEAWNIFQEVETEGGLLKAIENGTIQSAIQESQQLRYQAIASRGRIFVGTNQYTNPDDQMAAEIDSDYQTVALNDSDIDIRSDSNNLPEYLAEAFNQGAGIADIASRLFDFGKQHYRIVHTYRGPQAFEELRLATEKHKMTPKVLNLPLGDKNWRKARSAFSANFFGCAGFDIEDPISFENIDAAIKAVKEQQPDIAVICSSDKEYKELVPAIAKEVNSLENQPILVLAGHPQEDLDHYKEAGIDEFIYAKCNVLETLKKFQTKLCIIDN